MNDSMLAALARLRTCELLEGAAKRRALARDRKPDPALRVRAGRLLRSLGCAAIVLGDALAPRVL